MEMAGLTVGARQPQTINFIAKHHKKAVYNRFFCFILLLIILLLPVNCLLHKLIV
jgi:hypothetical protein